MRIVGLQQGALVALATCFIWIASITQLHAEGGLEEGEGGLFHRKGFIDQTAKPIRFLPGSVRTAARKDAGRPRAKVSRGVKVASLGNARLPARLRKRKRAITRAPRKRIVPRVKRRGRNKVQKVQPLPKLPVLSERNEKRKREKEFRIAALGDIGAVPLPSGKTPAKSKKKKSLTGGSARVQWVASSRCLVGRLRAAIYYVARNFGRVRVNSTCRSRRHNRRVGGARRSWHLTGRAADIRVFGNVRRAARYLRSLGGGYKHYGGGLFHIDTGPKRTW